MRKTADVAAPGDAERGAEPDAAVVQQTVDAAHGTIGSSEQAARQGLDAGTAVVESVDRALDARHDVVQDAEGSSRNAEAAIQAAGVQAEATAAAVSETVVETTAAAQDAAVTLADLNGKIAEAMRSTIEANLSFLTSLFGVRSLAQAADLNRDHLQRQMSAFASRSHELAVMTNKLAFDAMGAFARRDRGRRS